MKARTVRGDVPASSLGITLAHEHVLIDATCYFAEPADPAKRQVANAPVRMENLGEIKRDPFMSRDNLINQDAELATREVAHFKNAGGGTIVDCTSIGLGRNVEALKKISDFSGLNLIAGTGFYIQSSHPKYVAQLSIEDLVTQMIHEVEEGVDGTGIRCGIIGEIGTGWPIAPDEEKVLRAAACAQKTTGAPLNVHPAPFEKHGNRILDIIQEEGVDLSKVVLSHIDVCGYEPDYASSLAERGCYVEFDTFGSEAYYDSTGEREPSDAVRVDSVAELARRGYLSQILISHDVTYKIQLKSFGGYGFDHVSRHIVPMLKRAGLKDAEVNVIMMENPMRMLGF